MNFDSGSTLYLLVLLVLLVVIALLLSRALERLAISWLAEALKEASVRHLLFEQDEVQRKALVTRHDSVVLLALGEIVHKHHLPLDRLDLGGWASIWNGWCSMSTMSPGVCCHAF